MTQKTITTATKTTREKEAATYLSRVVVAINIQYTGITSETKKKAAKNRKCTIDIRGRLGAISNLNYQ